MPARVTRKSILTGNVRTLQLKKYSQEEFDSLMTQVEEGHKTLDEAFLSLSKEAKDFIAYGATKEEFEKEGF